MEHKTPYKPPVCTIDIPQKSEPRFVQKEIAATVKNIKDCVDDINNALSQGRINLSQALGYKQNIIKDITRDIRSNKKRGAIGHEQARVFKDKINQAFGRQGDKNWKEGILGIKIQPVFQTRKIKKTTKADSLDQTLNARDNARFSETTGENFCAISGTHFVENRIKGKNYYGSKPINPVKKASYVARQGEGWMMSIAGGKSERTATIAAKYAVQLMSVDPTADSFSSSVTSLASSIKNEVAIKTGSLNTLGVDHNITLTCARAFPLENGKFRLIGMNVSDGMVIAFNPDTREFHTIGNARQPIKASTPTCTELSNIDRFSSAYFDKELPEGTLVFCISQGIWKGLPSKQRNEIGLVFTVNTDKTLISEIDCEALSEDPTFALPRNITPHNLAQALLNYTVNRAETRRLEKTTKATAAEQKLLELEQQNKIKIDDWDESIQVLEQSTNKILAEEVSQAKSDVDFIIDDDFTIICTELKCSASLQKKLPLSNNLKPIHNADKTQHLSSTDSPTTKISAILAFVMTLIALGLFVGFKALAPVEMYVAALPFFNWYCSDRWVFYPFIGYDCNCSILSRET